MEHASYLSQVEIRKSDWEDIGDCWWWQIQKTVVKVGDRLFQLTGRRVEVDTEDIYNCYYEYDPIEIEEIKGEQTWTTN